MNWKDHISYDTNVMLGKPVIKGTRIPVDLILAKMGNGESVNELLEEYPHLVAEQIYAALTYASEFIQGEVSYENVS